MDAIRRARLATVIQEELALFVGREVRDPRVENVVFTKAEVTEDGKLAKVFITILGDRGEIGSDKIEECIEGLNSASGFLRKHLARILTVRHVPALLFKEDRGYENTQRVHELLKQIHATTGDQPADETDSKPDNSSSNE